MFAFWVFFSPGHLLTFLLRNLELEEYILDTWCFKFVYGVLLLALCPHSGVWKLPLKSILSKHPSLHSCKPCETYCSRSRLLLGQIQYILNCITTQVILTFSLVLAYDLFEDRCMLTSQLQSFLLYKMNRFYISQRKSKCFY